MWQGGEGTAEDGGNKDSDSESTKWPGFRENGSGLDWRGLDH